MCITCMMLPICWHQKADGNLPRELACSSSCARPMAMRPALQPMPERLYVTMLGRMRKWFTTMEASDGVGLKSEQFTIKISTCKPGRKQ